MAGYNAVQFYGAERVLEAYELRKLKAWGLFCDKDFLGSYEGQSMEEGTNALNSWCEMLGESVGVYTLKVYDSIPAGGITDKTPCKGSFKFRLKTPDNGGAGSGYASGNNNSFAAQMMREMKQENADLKQSIASLQDELNSRDDDKEDTSTIGSVLKNITQQPQFMQWCMSLFAPKQQQQPVYMPPPVSLHAGAGALGNVMEAPQPVFNSNTEITESELERLGKVYAMLRPKMPDALQLLEKLVELSIGDPQRFEGIKSTIKMFL